MRESAQEHVETTTNGTYGRDPNKSHASHKPMRSMPLSLKPDPPPSSSTDCSLLTAHCLLLTVKLRAWRQKGHCRYCHRSG
jgi:hypothetical protein